MIDSGWVPAQILFGYAPPLVEWRPTGTQAFTHPFMGETFRLCEQAHPFPFRVHMRTSMEALRQVAEASPTLSPCGFIFHLSRCGSTALSRALASDPANRVLSEPNVLGNVLGARQWVPSLEVREQQAWLRDTVAVLGRPLAGEQRYFIKFNSWAVCFLPMFRRLYPDVPWIFMFRHPLEILMSHRKEAAVFMLSHFPAALLGMKPSSQNMSDEEHQARVLASLGLAVLDALERDPGKVMLMDYAEMPAAVLERVFPFFGLPQDAATAARLNATLRVHAKTPQHVFEADSARRQAMASPALRHAAERWVTPVYHALCQARHARLASPCSS